MDLNNTSDVREVYNGKILNSFQGQKLNSTWVENLALEEINMQESGIIHMNDHLSPESLLEEASIQLMGTLRDHFEYFTTKFNSLRSNSSIKVFKISGTVNDFMLFRNTLRLIIARKSSELISVSFLSNGKEMFTARDSDAKISLDRGHLIRAHLGPFNKISWMYQGEYIDLEALVRHYLSEFIRLSAR